MTPGIPNPDHRPGGDPDCPLCRGEGYVCEDHPDLPWHHVNGDTDGAGVNCPRCNPREKEVMMTERKLVPTARFRWEQRPRSASAPTGIAPSPDCPYTLTLQQGWMVVRFSDVYPEEVEWRDVPMVQA